MIPKQEDIFAPPTICDEILGVKLPKTTKEKQLSEEAWGSGLKCEGWIQSFFWDKAEKVLRDFNIYACMNIIIHPSLN